MAEGVSPVEQEMAAQSSPTESVPAEEEEIAAAEEAQAAAEVQEEVETEQQPPEEAQSNRQSMLGSVGLGSQYSSEA